ncbi:hypothetical protein [Bordetella sp. LUAb4]|uniref:hypothetical protein n=1 Tax=Bordetella sp. LUAb4 TaxID=2843195 RepID=UPI001E4CD2C1|nr:hypothetical protein [Bordetella sp. LUAb4]
MSIDMYRRQVIQLRTNIAKLTEQKAREVQKAADAGMKSIAAAAAASKTSSTSTAQSKLREASRYADDQAKHEREIAKLERKIADEQKRFGIVQGRLDSEEAKALKKRNDEQKRQQETHTRRFRAMEASLTHHGSLHRETIARVDR